MTAQRVPCAAEPRLREYAALLFRRAVVEDALDSERRTMLLAMLDDQLDALEASLCAHAPYRPVPAGNPVSRAWNRFCAAINRRRQPEAAQ